MATERREPGRPIDERPAVDRPELVPTPTTRGTSERDSRQRARLTRRVSLGVAIGVMAGAAFGAILGSIAFSSGAAIAASALAAAAAIGGLGAFWGGMASLESTDAGSEPAEGDEPLDRPAITTERRRR